MNSASARGECHIDAIIDDQQCAHEFGLLNEGRSNSENLGGGKFTRSYVQGDATLQVEQEIDGGRNEIGSLNHFIIRDQVQTWNQFSPDICGSIQRPKRSPV